jgi:hypothetical protein
MVVAMRWNSRSSAISSAKLALDVPGASPSASTPFLFDFVEDS